MTGDKFDFNLSHPFSVTHNILTFMFRKLLYLSKFLFIFFNEIFLFCFISIFYDTKSFTLQLNIQGMLKKCYRKFRKNQDFFFWCWVQSSCDMNICGMKPKTTFIFSTILFIDFVKIFLSFSKSYLVNSRVVAILNKIHSEQF